MYVKLSYERKIAQTNSADDFERILRIKSVSIERKRRWQWPKYHKDVLMNSRFDNPIATFSRIDNPIIKKRKKKKRRSCRNGREKPFT